jgi:CubicO group peptidase (beta-lactamase class C family)
MGSCKATVGTLACLGWTMCVATSCAPGPDLQTRVETSLHEQPVMDAAHLFEVAGPRLQLRDRMAHHKVPGVSVTVVSGSRIQWSATYGVRDAATEAPADGDTIFETASTSKLVTAVLTMRLVQEGVLSLDDPVNDHLTRWQVPANELTQRRPVTLRMLLSHTAGINRPASMYAFEEGSSPTLLDVLDGSLPAINDPVTVEDLPGSRHRYSNIGYNVIQLLIEDATGRPFTEVMRSKVLEPLGMTSCTYEFPFTAATFERVAFPHDASMTPHMNDLHPSALAHGGLLCTSNDLAKLAVELIRAYHGVSDRILSRDTLEEMLTSQHDPEDDIGGFNGQGLGAFLLSDHDHLVFAHYGYNVPGTCCLLIVNPARGDAAVIMANGADGFPLIFEIMAAIAQVYHWPTIRPTTPTTA